eukprot:1156315-Pelagomonas_calceolata.AAC.3
MVQRAVSLLHQRVRGNLVWVWWVPGSMRPKGTRVMPSVFDTNGTSSKRCEHSTMSNMVTDRHNIASRILLEGVSNGPLGAGLASMDIGSANRLALQNLQIPEHSTTLPKFIFPHRFPDKDRLTPSRPYVILVAPMKRVPTWHFKDLEGPIPGIH